MLNMVYNAVLEFMFQNGRYWTNLLKEWNCFSAQYYRCWRFAWVFFIQWIWHPACKWTQFKQSRLNQCVTASGKQTQDLFCEFFQRSTWLFSVARRSCLTNTVIHDHYCTNVFALTQSCISVHKSVYKPNTNSISNSTSCRFLVYYKHSCISCQQSSCCGSL